MAFRRRARAGAAALALAASLTAACHDGDGPAAVTVADKTSRTLSADVGAEIEVRLQSIGPGEYESPPTVSSGVVRFIDVAYVGPFVPAGVTQRFRFEAVAPGRAVIVFRHTELNPTVEDTVNVR